MTIDWDAKLEICCDLRIGWGLGWCILFWWLKLPIKDVLRSNLVVDYQALHTVAALVGVSEGTLHFAWRSGPWDEAKMKGYFLLL